MRNPALNNSRNFIIYIVVIAIIATIYTCALNLAFGLPTEVVIINGLIIDVLLFFIFLFLWNILIFGAPKVENPVYTRVFYAGLGSLSIIIIIGLEILWISGLGPHIFNIYLISLPARVIILVLLFSITVLLHRNRRLKFEENKQEEREMEAKMILKEQGEEINIIERITVNSNRGIKVIPIKDILFIKANGDYVEIVTTEGVWLKEDTMKYYDTNLPEQMFARIHRSYIVNLEAITRISRYGEKKVVILKNNETIGVSATGDKVLKEKLKI